MKEELYTELELYLLRVWHPRPAASGHYQREAAPGHYKKAKEAVSGGAEYSYNAVIPADLDELLKRRQESFRELLFRLMDETGESDAEIYRRAGLDRRYFAKIRGGSIPLKDTVMALCLALKLDEDRATDLMTRAGYAFSDASRRDVIVRFCLEHEIYDLMDVNEVLDHYSERLLRE